MIKVGDRFLIPFKCAPAYLGVSDKWLREHEGKKGFPRRVVIGPRKTGYWKEQIDSWLSHREVRTRRQVKKAA